MDIRREDGVALMIAMMAMLLMTALGVMLILTTSSETIIAGNYRNSGEAMYAADAVLERAIDDLLTVSDWNSLLGGSVQSAFVDGAPGGARTLPDGSTIDLTQALNMANCEKVTTCSTTEMDAITTERPWGADNPRWQLYAYGRIRDLTPTDSIDSSCYVIVMVGDDPSENDNNPLLDGLSRANPGTGVMAMRAEAFGPRGAHKVVEITVARVSGNPSDFDNGVGQAGVRVLSWREVR